MSGSFLSDVEAFYNLATQGLDLPDGLAEKIKVANVTYTTGVVATTGTRGKNNDTNSTVTTPAKSTLLTGRMATRAEVELGAWSENRSLSNFRQIRAYKQFGSEVGTVFQMREIT